MARDTRDILFRFLGDAKSLERAGGKADKSLKGTQKVMGGLTKAVGALGLALGAREVLQFGLDAAKMAEQANLAGAAADKVLGPAADRLRDRFSDLRGVMGFNSLEFDQLIAKQGLLVTGMGASSDVAGELIGDLITLGGEAAAFTGEVARTEEAIDAVGAAIRGEFDPLEQWGVKLKESQIAAEIARREGIDPLFAAMSDGEKRLIVIRDFIEDALTPALGSLGDAADTAAGKQNDLTADFEDMKIELGQSLLPALQDLTQALIDLKPLFEGLAFVVGGIAKQFANAAGIVSGFTGLFSGSGNSLEDRINKASDAIAKFMTLGILGSGYRDNFKSTVEGWLDALGRLGNLIIRVTGRAGSFISKLVSIRNFSLPRFFHSGGVVPQGNGQAVPAMLQSGERVLPRGSSGNGGGDGMSVTINIGVAGDPQATAQQIVNLLETFNRNQGAIPIEVRNANGII